MIALRDRHGEIGSVPPAVGALLFDCASLTKPLVTAALVRRLGIHPEEPLAFSSEYAPFPNGTPTVGHALSHTTGMPRWLPVYALAGSPEGALRLLPGRQEAAPGVRTEYSCPGFILLGRWIEIRTGRTLPDLAREHLLAPLEIEREAFFPFRGELPRDRVVPTELGNRIEREMAGGAVEERPSPIWGEVHDGNSRFLGGAAGNAGLFATARAVLRLAEAAWAVPERPLPPGTFWNGWKAGGEGTCFPEGTLGHTGFTGTSVCLHLRQGTVSVLLTSRLHQENPPDLFELRKRFHSTPLNSV
jgi:CubicO group peptidase (beta-lactamase class C family)